MIKYYDKREILSDKQPPKYFLEKLEFPKHTLTHIPHTYVYAQIKFYSLASALLKHK